MAVVFAELERDFIRMRTREALQVKKENGVTLGRPRSTPEDVVARIVRERTEGKTTHAIAHFAAPMIPEEYLTTHRLSCGAISPRTCVQSTNA